VNEARRVNVVGISGAGKTTLGRELAKRLGVRFVELDGLHHGPNWREATAEELRARVEAAIEDGEGWVIDGNYQRKFGNLVFERAETVVWLDLPLHLALGRLWRRTWGRIIWGEELWNGNRESLRNAFFVKDSLFVWTVKSYLRQRWELPERVAECPHLRVVRLRTPREVERFLAGEKRGANYGDTQNK
jgi:adenylate kinase family enzyme